MARSTDDLNSLTEAERLRLTPGLSPEERLQREGSLLTETERQDLADPTLSEAERQRLGNPSLTAAPLHRIDPAPSGLAQGNDLDLTEAERLRMAERLDAEGVIERVEERAVIGKRVVDTGGVRVSTRTEVGTEMVSAALQELKVELEHVPVGRFVEAMEEPRVEGDVTILPVYEERLVVERRLYLVEEVHMRRVARTHEIQEPVEIRRQVVDVERLPPQDGLPD
jgi:stress response protein YsnF